MHSSTRIHALIHLLHKTSVATSVEEWDVQIQASVPATYRRYFGLLLELMFIPFRFSLPKRIHSIPARFVSIRLHSALFLGRFLLSTPRFLFVLPGVGSTR